MAESYGMGENTLTPKPLLAADADFLEKSVTVLSGEGVLVRGTLLGKITKGAASAAYGTNTGNGVAGTITLGQKAKIGAYKLTCTGVASHIGTFKVVDPSGYRLDDLVAGTAYSNGHFGVTVTNGVTDWVAGDTITITVAAGSGKYRAYNDAHTDGSDEACCVLGRDIDATSGDVATFAYITGSFMSSALTGVDDAAKVDFDNRQMVIK